MSSVQFTGSASFGMIRTTAPLATLSADASLLTLKVAFTNYCFYPHQVAALQWAPRKIERIYDKSGNRAGSVSS